MGVLFSSPSKKNVARVMNFLDKSCLTDQNIDE